MKVRRLNGPSSSAGRLFLATSSVAKADSGKMILNARKLEQGLEKWSVLSPAALAPLPAMEPPEETGQKLGPRAISATQTSCACCPAVRPLRNNTAVSFHPYVTNKKNTLFGRGANNQIAKSFFV